MRAVESDSYSIDHADCVRLMLAAGLRDMAAV